MYGLIGVTELQLTNDIALANGATVAIPWSVVDLDDLGLRQSNGLDLAIPDADLWYEISARANFANPMSTNSANVPATGSYGQIWASINGVDTGLRKKPTAKMVFPRTGGSPTANNVGTFRRFTTGDVLRFFAYQNSGYASMLRHDITVLSIKCWGQ